MSIYNSVGPVILDGCAKSTKSRRIHSWRQNANQPDHVVPLCGAVTYPKDDIDVSAVGPQCKLCERAIAAFYCRCVRADGETRFNINCVIHGSF